MRLKLEQQIIEIVHKRRRSLPREGVRKLKVSLDDEFTKANLKVGRDTLFNVLRKHQMLTQTSPFLPPCFKVLKAKQISKLPLQLMPAKSRTQRILVVKILVVMRLSP